MIHYAGEDIPYQLYLSKEGGDFIRVKVLPSGDVQVFASGSTTQSRLNDVLKTRAQWVYQERARYEQLRLEARERDYTSGEKHHYLGKPYQLRVTRSTQNSVRIYRGMIDIKTKNTSIESVRQLLFSWYKAKAKALFTQRIALLVKQTPWVKKTPILRLQTTRTQFAACSASSSITLNPHLIKAREEQIDAVIMHALCHIKHDEHHDKFWRLLHRVMPDYQERYDALALHKEDYLLDVMDKVKQRT